MGYKHDIGLYKGMERYSLSGMSLFSKLANCP